MDEPTSRPTDQKMIYIVACPEHEKKKKERTNIAKFEPDIEPISEQRKGMILPKDNGVLNKTLGRLLRPLAQLAHFEIICSTTINSLAYFVYGQAQSLCSLPHGTAGQKDECKVDSWPRPT